MANHSIKTKKSKQIANRIIQNLSNAKYWLIELADSARDVNVYQEISDISRLLNHFCEIAEDKE